MDASVDGEAQMNTTTARAIILAGGTDSRVEDIVARAGRQPVEGSGSVAADATAGARSQTAVVLATLAPSTELEAGAVVATPENVGHAMMFHVGVCPISLKRQVAELTAVSFFIRIPFFFYWSVRVSSPQVSG